MKRDTKKLILRKYIDQFLTEDPKRWDWTTKGQRSADLKEFLWWLQKEKWQLEELDAVRLRRFIQFLVDKKIHHQKRYHIRRSVFLFIEWLHAKDFPIQNPRELLPYQKPRADLIQVTLPAYTEEFLSYVSTRVRPATASIYKTTCKHFHKFLLMNSLDLKDINRKVMEQYFMFLVKCNQANNTRLTNLVQLRIYLQWLKERRLVSCKPAEMVRSKDLPKVPEYLPRPLSPAIDQLIQKRLAKSHDRFHKALLLMRWTGLRIGELARLSFDCIKTDLNNHKFLKVPLGKLDNERLVPIDEKTVKLIKTIQEQTAQIVRERPLFLLSEKTLKAPRTYLLMHAFKEIHENIKTDDPIVSHRLRHTYATELLSAGMNICALKEILGHHDINMTLRYAAVTQEKVRIEYFAALERMKNNFSVDLSPTPKQEGTDYNLIFFDLSLELRKRAPIKGFSNNKVNHLIKRVNRLKKEVQNILF